MAAFLLRHWVRPSWRLVNSGPAQLLGSEHDETDRSERNRDGRYRDIDKLRGRGVERPAGGSKPMASAPRRTILDPIMMVSEKTST